MLLTIDIGNTETKIGVFDGDELFRTWRFQTDRRRTPDEITMLFAQIMSVGKLGPRVITQVVVSSVVPQLDKNLQCACRTYFMCEPLFFTAATQTLLPVRTERPREVGSDLVAAAIGAVQAVGVPVIVVHYGTATTFGAVDANGEYLGSAIAPGIQISVDALVDRTAKLPQVALEAPQRAIGCDTVSALRSGIVFGFVGASEYMVAKFRLELGVPAPVIATGGLAEIIAAESSVIELVDPYLVLRGLHRYACSQGDQAPSE